MGSSPATGVPLGSARPTAVALPPRGRGARQRRRAKAAADTGGAADGRVRPGAPARRRGGGGGLSGDGRPLAAATPAAAAVPPQRAPRPTPRCADGRRPAPARGGPAARYARRRPVRARAGGSAAGCGWGGACVTPGRQQWRRHTGVPPLGTTIHRHRAPACLPKPPWPRAPLRRAACPVPPDSKSRAPRGACRADAQPRRRRYSAPSPLPALRVVVTARSPRPQTHSHTLGRPLPPPPRPGAPPAQVVLDDHPPKPVRRGGGATQRGGVGVGYETIEAGRRCSRGCWRGAACRCRDVLEDDAGATRASAPRARQRLVGCQSSLHEEFPHQRETEAAFFFFFSQTRFPTFL